MTQMSFRRAVLVCVAVIACEVAASAQSTATRVGDARAAEQEGPRFFTHIKGYVSAQGSWLLTSGKPGDEVGYSHVVKIECRGDFKDCTESIAGVILGLLQIDVGHYGIIRWDANGIIADDDAGICATNRLLINFRDKSVMLMDIPKADSQGKGIPLPSGKHACDLLDHTIAYKLGAQEQRFFTERKIEAK